MVGKTYLLPNKTFNEFSNQSNDKVYMKTLLTICSLKIGDGT